MHLLWQVQDADNSTISDFAKASRSLQFLELPGAFVLVDAAL